jgi:hypothetical protein
MQIIVVHPRADFEARDGRYFLMASGTTPERAVLAAVRKLPSDKPIDSVSGIQVEINYPTTAGELAAALEAYLAKEANR